jgi:hypothetical protein
MKEAETEKTIGRHHPEILSTTASATVAFQLL